MEKKGAKDTDNALNTSVTALTDAMDVFQLELKSAKLELAELKVAVSDAKNKLSPPASSPAKSGTELRHNWTLRDYYIICRTCGRMLCPCPKSKPCIHEWEQDREVRLYFCSRCGILHIHVRQNDVEPGIHYSKSNVLDRFKPIHERIQSGLASGHSWSKYPGEPWVCVSCGVLRDTCKIFDTILLIDDDDDQWVSCLRRRYSTRMGIV